MPGCARRPHQLVTCGMECYAGSVCLPEDRPIAGGVVQDEAKVGSAEGARVDASAVFAHFLHRLDAVAPNELDRHRQTTKKTTKQLTTARSCYLAGAAEETTHRVR